jgi:hypothetical protein
MVKVIRKETVFFVVPADDQYTYFSAMGEKVNWSDKRCPDYQGIACRTAFKKNWGDPIRNNYVELYDGEEVTLEPGEHLLKIDAQGRVKIIK